MKLLSTLLGVVAAATPMSKDTAVFNMQHYYTTMQSSAFNWYPPPIGFSQKKLDANFDGIFTEIAGDQTTSISVAYAQMANINHFAAGTQTTSKVHTDDIIPIIAKGADASKNPLPYHVGKTGQNFLQYLIAAAHKNNVTVDLQFGGSGAVKEDWILPGDGASTAGNLAKFIEAYGFDSVSFDLSQTRGSGIDPANNDTAKFDSFFTALKSALAKKATVMLVVAPTIADGAEKTLSYLFKDWAKKFDGLCIKAYSTGVYFLDADDERWGVKQWAAFVPPEQIHLGFNELIKYNGKASSSGKKYDIPTGVTNGQAAAFVNGEVKKDLKALDAKKYANLGRPYFFVDKPSFLPHDPFLSDFHNWKMGKSTFENEFLNSDFFLQ